MNNPSPTKEKPIVAAVIENRGDRDFLVEQLSAEVGIDRDKIHFVSGETGIHEPEAPSFDRLNPNTASQTFLIPLAVAILGMVLVLVYHRYFSTAQGDGMTSLIIGTSAAVLVAILSGVFAATGLPKRKMEKLFTDLQAGDAVIEAECSSDDQARSFIANLEKRGMNKIRVLTPTSIQR